MTDYEEPVANEVRRLLMTALPKKGDAALAKAAELSGPEKNTTILPRNDCRGGSRHGMRRAGSAAAFRGRYR